MWPGTGHFLSLHFSVFIWYGGEVGITASLHWASHMQALSELLSWIWSCSVLPTSLLHRCSYLPISQRWQLILRAVKSPAWGLICGKWQHQDSIPEFSNPNAYPLFHCHTLPPDILYVLVTQESTFPFSDIYCNYIRNFLITREETRGKGKCSPTLHVRCLFKLKSLYLQIITIPSIACAWFA